MKIHRSVLRMLPIAGAVAALLFGVAADTPPAEQSQRQKAEKLQRDGNYKDALQIYEKLVMEKTSDAGLVGKDLENAVQCMRSLNRVNEFDAFIEKALAVHGNNWRFLFSAAHRYFDVDHYGFIVAGNFQRGHHRGGGEYVNSFERDRVRAMQLMADVLKKSADEKSKPEVAEACHFFAQVLMGYRQFSEAWRLQYLSDLAVLPDYDQGWYRYDYMAGSSGAPVDKDGKPVFHQTPAGFEEAKSDGERWRWLLKRTAELDANREEETAMEYADFLRNQFGVQTMAYCGEWFRGANDSDDKDGRKKDESGTYALHTLAENETIARLANGIKRFKLPEDADFIKIYRKIADAKKTSWSEKSLEQLARIFGDRRQYDKSAELWQRCIREYGAGHDNYRQKAVDQILGNWGRFEPTMTRPAGEEATVQFKFRNGKKVTFAAYQVKVAELLADLKQYLKSNPAALEWERVNLGNIGYMLVEKNQTKYIGEKVNEWALKLEPRANHFDKRITVKTPLKKAGAYLLVGTMEDGNTSRIIMWLDDTVIVKKPTKGGAFVFVADAVTGQPLPKVNVEFFGYYQKWLDNRGGGRQYNVYTTAFADDTDDNGLINVPAKTDRDNYYQWLLTATTPEGRLAFLGFSSIWSGDYHDAEYNQTKVFGITDRPVYRPDQKVKFKFWIREAKYDQENKSAFANQDFAVIILNPKGDKIFDKTFKTDAYGGLDSEFALPKDAMLGQYYAYILQHNKSYGGVHFRVEEYKKPEFEVKVEAPKEPVMLGEKITATISAKYYFGAPVAKGKVKYKILRSDYAANWYPCGRWDWLYGRGYWWFCYDYEWYPAWIEWGCPRPHCWWWPAAYNPPEVVAETESVISPDGVMKVEIDTALAKEMHSDSDHKYEITAEVTDESRRTIVGQGSVLVARKPFKVYTWVDRGHYQVGDPILIEVSAQTLDNKPVKGAGAVTLYKISYKNADTLDRKDMKVDEKKVGDWVLNTGEEGTAHLQIKASEPGQYRVSYKLTDEKKHTIEGGQVFCVTGEGFDGKKFRFDEIELIPQEKEYAPNEKVKLMINTDRAGSAVVLFVRPANGIYLEPKVIRLKGKSTVEEIGVTKKDMPNFFVEAFTISNGRFFDEMKEIVVPPEKRILNVEVTSSADKYKPGETAKVKVKVTDMAGKPYAGTTVMSVFDKSVEYISGGSNVAEIKDFFWKWRRHHYPASEHTLGRWSYNLIKHTEITLQGLGVFGELVADEAEGGAMNNAVLDQQGGFGGEAGEIRQLRAAPAMSAGLRPKEPMANGFAVTKGFKAEAAADRIGGADKDAAPAGGMGEGGLVEATVRSEFADTAFWAPAIATDEKGEALAEFKMPENLTGWKIRSWAMGHGTVVGEGTVEVVTTKNLLLRLQAPRFFVEKDEVVLSANIHNYLKSAKKVKAVLELKGGCIEAPADAARNVEIPAGDEKRVDWRVKVVKEGQAVVRMKALSDEESDAMQMKFPVYVHGMLKTDSFCGVIRRDEKSQKISIEVPKERRADQSVLEVRYSPTLAGAMVDALPYLVEYPYACTEQTLNRFLPTVITQKILKDMGLDLKTIAEKRTNLNAQEIGDDKKRADDWKRVIGDKRWDGKEWVERNPVFDEAVVRDMVREGLRALTAMQLSDGGWGWFSGWGEHSYPHTTAYVVHGMQVAQQNGVGLVPGVLDRGVQWLVNYQAEELRRIKNAEGKINPWKEHADELDAFVYMVLTDAGKENKEMREFLYRDRTKLAVYAKAMFGMGLNKIGDKEKLDMIMQNIEQFLVMDKENQTAYLNLGNEGYWWYWYGSEYEAQAYYLKLLSATDPKSDKAAWLVKYLLNNRRHASYWNSTRDTAVCLEAMADFLRASKEDKPDMTIEILVDGKKVKEVTVNAENIFSFDNKLLMEGDALASGKHTVEVRRKGEGPVYFNAYLTNFTLEDNIKKAGLEIKVNRKYYKLNKVDKKIKVEGDMGQALDQKVEKYERAELADLAKLKSGDLVEIELEVDSKNDYEYIVFEDMKAAGFEPVDVRSGYTGNGLGAYMEFRDERVCMFVRQLARGKHSVAYRVRAEIPGLFSALPTKVSAMYAPELRANSDEIKLGIED